MAMPDHTRRYTVEEVLAFPPDGNRYELMDGELLVTPAPRQRHQLVTGVLYRRLAGYLDAYPDLAAVFFSPADITWGRRRLVQPDIFVVPAPEVTGDWRDCQHLLLAVEVLSPSSVRADRVVKRRVYREQRVATYWIVDADARLVEVWRPDDRRPEIVEDTLRWRVSHAAAPLELKLAEVFRGLPPVREA
jgi:Uma2 family endonuclease